MPELDAARAPQQRCSGCGIALELAGAFRCKTCARAHASGSTAARRPRAMDSDERAVGAGWGRKLLVAAVAGALLFVLLHKRAPSYGPGVLIQDEPLQLSTNKILVENDQYTITALASYQIKARVLGAKTYDSDFVASVAPLDLALGWQAMSSDTLLGTLRISQSNRFYFWRTDAADFPRKQIETQSANHHMIPADAQVRKQLMKLGEGELVALRGYLVKVTFKRFPDRPWVSSLTREDVGNGACEIVYVEQVEAIAPP
ncbi:MAG: hypothetical protein V4582_06280 [Pseudomonadota bacterium]